MKRLLLIILTSIIVFPATAQVVITGADMPVSGDTLRYSTINPVGSPIVLTDTGAGVHWNYIDLIPVSQAVDTYKSAYEVNPVYAGTISLSARGYKVADSIPGLSMVLSGVTLDNIYTFFENISSPQAYIAAAFAARVAGLLPVAFNYTEPDALYFFPLGYGNTDSSGFDLNISLLTAGSIKQKGYRKTHVDGWGVIITPYHTTPVNCIRLRSEIHEIDTVSLGSTGTFGIPRNTVEYKWLANGEHYPVLFVTANVIGGIEIPTAIRYHDVYRELNPNGVKNNSVKENTAITAYPNPATDGNVTLTIPAGWRNFYVEVFDTRGKLLTTVKDQHELNISTYAAGNYLARITYGETTAYVTIVK